jgi:hypothetical protein
MWRCAVLSPDAPIAARHELEQNTAMIIKIEKKESFSREGIPS